MKIQFQNSILDCDKVESNSSLWIKRENKNYIYFKDIGTVWKYLVYQVAGSVSNSL